MSTGINVLARKEVTVQRRKFVMANSTDLDCGSLKCINEVDLSDCHLGKIGSLILSSCLKVRLNSSIFIRSIRGVIVTPVKAEEEGSDPKKIFFPSLFFNHNQ